MNLIIKLTMKFTLFIAILFLSATANSQQELRNVFREIDPLDFTRAKFYLVDSIENRTKKKITNDNAVYFAASVDNFSSVWTNKLFDSAVIVSRKYIDSVAKESIFDVPKHFSFSLPYFSKDKQSFLIYYSYWCGSLCAEHSLRLYKRVGKKWKFAKYIFIEVS